MGKLNKTGVLVLGVLLLVGLFAAEGSAQQVPTKENQWNFYFNFYFWPYAQTGDIKVKGEKFDVNWTTADSINNLGNLQFYFGGHFEGFKNNWGFLTDLFYTKIQIDRGTPKGTIQFKNTYSLFELMVPYRIYLRPGVVDLFAGGRYNYIDNSLGLPERDMVVSDSKMWVDPVIGARLIYPIARQWNFILRADFGGFGLFSNCADLAVNLNGGVSYQITPLVSITGGYKAYYIKYNESDFELNTWTHGPWLGVGFSF